jgi:hypothetical protein
MLHIASCATCLSTKLNSSCRFHTPALWRQATLHACSFLSVLQSAVLTVQTFNICMLQDGGLDLDLDSELLDFEALPGGRGMGTMLSILSGSSSSSSDYDFIGPFDDGFDDVHDSLDDEESLIDGVTAAAAAAAAVPSSPTDAADAGMPVFTVCVTVHCCIVHT